MLIGLKPRFHAKIGRPSLMANTADAGLMTDISIERDSSSSPQGTVKPETGLQRIAHPPDLEGISKPGQLPVIERMRKVRASVRPDSTTAKGHFSTGTGRTLCHRPKMDQKPVHIGRTVKLKALPDQLDLWLQSDLAQDEGESASQ